MGAHMLHSQWVVEARVAITVAVSTESACWAIWAIGVWSKLLCELLLLCDGILDSLLLGRHIVLILLLLSSNKLLVLLFLRLHELLALRFGIVEGLLFGLTDLLDLFGSHAVRAVWVAGSVEARAVPTIRTAGGAVAVAVASVWGGVWKQRHCDARWPPC